MGYKIIFFLKWKGLFRLHCWAGQHQWGSWAWVTGTQSLQTKSRGYRRNGGLWLIWFFLVLEVLSDFGDFNCGVIFGFQVFIWCTLWFSFRSLVCQWTLHFEGKFPSPAWRRDFCGCTNHGNRGWNDLVFLPAGNVLGWWAFRRLMFLPISTETRFPNLDGEGFGWNWRFMDFCFFLETNRGLGCFFSGGLWVMPFGSIWRIVMFFCLNGKCCNFTWYSISLVKPLTLGGCCFKDS